MDTIDFVEKNNKILERWEDWNQKHESAPSFAPDGIMYRGEFYNGDGYCERFEKNDLENRIWAEYPTRYLFVTKDQNTGGEDAWDVRGETAIKSNGSSNLPCLFHRNLVYLLYGLTQVTPEKYIEYDTFTNEQALEVFNNVALARINVKKQAGESSISNVKLKEYIDRDRNFIAEQIIALDADIIVCCGYSDSVDNTGNLILNFLNESCYHFNKVNNWIYYDISSNKIAINAWHLSYRQVSSKDFYTDMMQAYQDFLSKYPNFIVSHR